MFFGLSGGLGTFQHFRFSCLSTDYYLRLYFTFFEIFIEWILVIILILIFLDRRRIIDLNRFKLFGWRSKDRNRLNRSSVSSRRYRQIICEWSVNRHCLGKSTLVHTTFCYSIDSCCFVPLSTLNKSTYIWWVLFFIKFVEVVVLSSFFNVVQVHFPSIVESRHLVRILPFFQVTFQLFNLLYFMNVFLLCVNNLVFLFCLSLTKINELWSIFIESVIQSNFLSKLLFITAELIFKITYCSSQSL